MSGEFVDFLKERLEDGLSREIPRLAEIERHASAMALARASRRRRFGIWGASLGAACAALAFSFAFTGADRPAISPEATVSSVIDLLMDGEESGSGSVADKFLAWQDAPYVCAVEGI